MIGRRAWDHAVRTGRSLYRDHADQSATTFLLSSGRSGSTWLGSALQSLPETRQIFEPFHASRGIPSLAQYRYQYLTPDTVNPQMVADLHALLANSSWNGWVEQFNPILQFRYRRRLVKEVRINLLLPALLDQFSECRILLLLRHPAAVVLSQLSEGWLLSPERLYEQPDLAEMPWVRELQNVELSEDPFERNLAFWAVENRIALDAVENAGTPVLFYEEICMRPEAQLSRLEVYLEARFPAAARENMDGASWSSSKAVSDYSLEQKISAWQSRITPSQERAMLRILEASGLDRVYGSGTLPKTD